MAKYKFGKDTIEFDSDDDAIRYAEDMGFTPIASEMRQRAKTEFARDMLEQKRQEAESIRETIPGKIASSVFPRMVRSEIESRIAGDQDSRSAFEDKSYSAIKDAMSFPGRVLASGVRTVGDIADVYMNSPKETTPQQYDSLVGNLNAPRRFAEGIGKIENQNLFEQIVTDPLLPPLLAAGGIGALGGSKAAGFGARVALGASIPLADRAIELAKQGETPSGWDYGMAAAQGIVPELLKGVGTAMVRKLYKSPRSDMEAVELLKKHLADNGLGPDELVESQLDLFAAQERAAANPISKQLEDVLPDKLSVAADVLGGGGLATGYGALQKLPRAAKLVYGFPKTRDALELGARLLQSEKVNTPLVRAAVRALDSLRHNPNDASANATLQEYIKLKNEQK